MKKNLKFDECSDCRHCGTFWCTRCDSGERFEEKDVSLRFEEDPWRAMREMDFDDYE